MEVLKRFMKAVIKIFFFSLCSVSVARIRTTLFVGGASDAILPPLRTFSHDAIYTISYLIHNTTSSGHVTKHLAARFEYHFESKIAQLSGIIKSPIFLKHSSNFGIGSLKRWTFKILKHWFGFIYTLSFFPPSVSSITFFFFVVVFFWILFDNSAFSLCHV